MSTNTFTIIVSSLKIIIDDLIAERESLNYKAIDLSSDINCVFANNKSDAVFFTVSVETNFVEKYDVL